MKNKGIVLLIGVLVVVIVIVLTMDYRSGKVDNASENPYEYNYDEFKRIDPDLVSYEEFRQIKLDFTDPGGISEFKGKLYLVGDKSLRVIDKNGTEYLNTVLPETAIAVSAKNDTIAIAYKRFYELRNSDGKLMHQSEVFDTASFISSIALNKGKVYLADAGQRKVLIFNRDGSLISEIEGVSEPESLHGFIIPSANFDLAINAKDELWVVNPGMHSLQHYDEAGALIRYWKKASIQLEGFSGCCNPANFTFLPNGNFITAEKGLVRIKEYNENGEMITVVAPPDKYGEGGKSPDITADENGIIFAMDKDKNLIRMYRPKSK